MDTYIETLEASFSVFIKEYMKLRLNDYSKKTLDIGSKLVSDGSKLIKIMRLQLKTFEHTLSDCADFIEEVETDLTEPIKSDTFVYLSENGMLSIPGREYIEKVNVEKVSEKDNGEKDNVEKVNGEKVNGEKVSCKQSTLTSAPPTSAPIVEKVLISEINYNMLFPIVTSLDAIPPAMYYYKADKHPIGIYMRMPNGTIVRVPFPEVVDSKKEFDRKHSIRCKYHTKHECDLQRQKMAKTYNSQIRVCNFAHAGDNLIKIGYPSHCPNIPCYGNPTTMSFDIKHANINDIKNILLYGMSDLMAAAVWFDYYKVDPTILDSLEKVR